MFLFDWLGTRNSVEISKTENWFEDALEIDVYAGSTYPQVKELTDDLFKEISESKLFYKTAKAKETLKMILLNLWVSYHCDKPISYSRSPNNYSHPKRYGKLRFKYDRVIPIIDTLEKMGFLEQVKGFYDRDKDIGRQTRMYATHDLIKTFNDTVPASFDVVERLPRREIIELKDEEKNLIDYEDNDHTEEMRKNLLEYNQFINSQILNFEIPPDLPLKWKQLNTIRHNLLRGMIRINKLADESTNRITFMDNIDSNKSISSNSIIHKNINSKYYNSTVYPIDITTTDTHDYYPITTMTNKVSDIVKNSSSLEDKNAIFRLCDFGINFLDCQLKFELLHRVFNNESFGQGGRFFGAGHLELPKKVRKHHIRINGSPTVELDFSAMHIRMLYHLEDRSYTDDPYSILCDSEEERKVYKLAQLIAINASDEKKAVKAIRNEFRKKGIKYDLTDKSIGKLLTSFEEAHQPIAKYISTGKGLELQNWDSIITEFILMDLMKKGIAVLPVHDSYIVEKSHEGLLAEKMVEAYEIVMGFTPVIG